VTPRAAACALAPCALLAAAPPALDSQYVLQRYAIAVAAVTPPKTVVYSYTVSQVGPNNIEQHHRIYRSAGKVRDETLSVDGIPLGRKIVRFSQHPERYAVARFAPHTNAYELLFLGTVRDGHHVDYQYEATPLSATGGARIDRLTIDGVTFLPRVVHFHSMSLGAVGSGVIVFARFGKYWMPVIADAQARINGKPAREHIVWSDYRFPDSLPPSTFTRPEPLPLAKPSPE
jgi:hypothetical protein